MKNFVSFLLAVSMLVADHRLLAQGTVFTYQGELNNGGIPASGQYDFTFALFNNNSTNLGQVGGTVTNLGVGVTNGLFTVPLDFGGVFNGANYWLAIGVRTSGGSNFTALSPLQALTPSPYALYAPNAGSAASANSVSAINITGTVSAAQLPAGLVTNGSPSLTLGSATAIAPLTVPPQVPVSAIGSVHTDFNPSYIALAGRYVYVVTSGGNTLQIFDASKPSAPALVGSVSTGPASGPQSVAVAGRYAYVINRDQSPSLQVFDVSNPFAPVSVGSVATVNPENVAVAGRYAYVTSDGTALQIFDVANPSAPVRVGSAGAGIAGGFVAVVGRYAYVNCMGSKTLQIFDVGNPMAPVTAGSVGTVDYPLQVAVSGRYAYVITGASSGDRKLKVFDVSNPSVPALVGSLDLGGGAIGSLTVAGRYAYFTTYTSNTLQIYDVGNPSAPASVGSVGTDNIPGPAAVSGRYIYVANYGSSTLQVFDLGGAYIQQFEAGTIETGTLQTRDTMTVGNDLDVRGGLTVSASARISGGLGADSISAGSVTAVTLTQTSDRNAKEDFALVNPTEILDKVAALPISEWRFKTDETAWHLGPMAQDFRAAFNLGLDDRHITTVDEEGVALAAIQGLNLRLDAQRAENAKLRQQNESLKNRLDQLEQTVQSLTEKK